VDIADPIYNLNYLFTMGPPPELPFTECGVDPTPDSTECDEFTPCLP